MLVTFSRRGSFIGVLALAALLLLPGAAHGSTRLYLKDGSYQLVKSYEVRGDRVRYYSIERSDWEEIPASLVDFDATKRNALELESEQARRVDQAKRLEHQRFEATAPTGFQVAPGFHLPNQDGVYAFDGRRVYTLIQSGGRLVTDKKRLALSIAVPGPLLKGRSLVEIDGAHAAVRLANLQPTFYIQAADNWGAQAQLIPVKTAKESRVVEKIQSGVGVGKSGELRDIISIERQQVAPGLYLIKPVQPLDPGEYALGEMVPENKQEAKLNIAVWDFGVDGAPGPLSPTGDLGPAPMTEESPDGRNVPRPGRSQDPAAPYPRPASAPRPTDPSNPTGQSPYPPQ